MLYVKPVVTIIIISVFLTKQRSTNYRIESNQSLTNLCLSLPCQFLDIINVEGVMEMENIAPRAGSQFVSLAFRASVVTNLVSLMSPHYLHLPVFVAPCLRGQCRLLQLPSPSWNCLKLYKYRQWPHIYIYKHGGFKNHTPFTLYRWWTWEIVHLQWESNPQLLHSGQYANHYTA